jgi:translation initiation factor 2B subunit (eIF-2B alpha/beta/delta family)
LVCKNSRRNLKSAKEQIIERVLAILANYRKRQRYKVRIRMEPTHHQRKLSTICNSSNIFKCLKQSWRSH